MVLPIVSQKLPNSTSTKSIALFARWACLQSAMSSDTLEAERHKKNKFAVAYQRKALFPCLHSHNSDSFDVLCDRGHFMMNHSHQVSCTLLGSDTAEQLSQITAYSPSRSSVPQTNHMHCCYIKGALPKRKYGFLRYLLYHYTTGLCPFTQRYSCSSPLKCYRTRYELLR